MRAPRLAIAFASLALFAASLAPLAAFAYSAGFTVYASQEGDTVNVTVKYSGIVSLRGVEVTVYSGGEPVAGASDDILYPGESISVLIPLDRLSGDVTIVARASVSGLYTFEYEVEYHGAGG